MKSTKGRYALLGLVVAGTAVAVLEACSSSSTTTTPETDSGATTVRADSGSGTDSGSSGNGDGGGNGNDSGIGSVDTGAPLGGDAGPGESCPGPAQNQGGCQDGYECESFNNKGGNFCTKHCSDPGNTASADCVDAAAAFTGKCTPNSYCQLN